MCGMHPASCRRKDGIVRRIETERKTAETDIMLKLNLDGSGVCKIETGVGFFDHMLTLFAKHGNFDIGLVCGGDLAVDAHHTVEDCGIVIGRAFAEAIGGGEGIRRYCTETVPMDEALVSVSTDVSGRAFLVFNAELPKTVLGVFDSELCVEFFRAFAHNAGVTMHINLHYGSNTHHMIEAIFKAAARSLKGAVAIDPTVKGVPSTKGVL